MNRCVALLLGIFSTLTVAGQNPDGGVKFWGEDSTEHFIVWVAYRLSDTPRLLIDNGRARGQPKDSAGKPLRFSSAVAALNYFSKRGFEVIGVTTDQSGDGREYLLRRKKSP